MANLLTSSSEKRAQLRRRNLSFRFSPKAIRRAEQAAASLTDSEVRSRSEQIREQVINKGGSANLVTEFAGLVCEAISRTHGFRLFDVQLQAVVAGTKGAIVEMQTGEGKTVVTGATAAVKSLMNGSVHVGTTNTYLAERDLESLKETFDLLGISNGLLPEEPNEAESRRVYRKQIVYGPGYQFGFDYLRDQMNLRKNRQSRLGAKTATRIRGVDPMRDMIQRTFHDVALIDEADSVMIDEAMTPLIISLPTRRTEDPQPYLLAKKFVADLEAGRDYRLEGTQRRLNIFDETEDQAHQFIAERKSLKLRRPWRIYIANALQADQLLKRNVDYVVVEDEVQIVDKHTGRILPDRNWQDGLHQAVEAKEGVSIKPGRESTAQITRQIYLQMYDELSGLTGTAMSAAAEFKKFYGCGIVAVKTNKRCIRKVHKPRFFVDQDAKIQAIAKEVLSRHQTGQPILIGTRTIHESLLVRDALVAEGLTPTVLNGVQDREEAEIVSEAGMFNALTIATNMAGRGTDIKLEEKAVEAGGLHVLGFSPNTSRRIDRQLVGRAARQGQPGSAQFFVSAEDDIFNDHDPRLGKSIAQRAKANGEAPSFSRELLTLQDKIEAQDFKRRSEMILRDRWLDTVREAIEKE